MAFPKPIGGYECEYVDPIPESLICPVCLLPFCDPHLLDCCGAKYCAECIGRVKASVQPVCPVCKHSGFNTMLDKNDQRRVLILRVRCSMKKEGCKWEGELRRLNDHEKDDCGWTIAKCRFGCGGRIPRRRLAEHEQDECPQRSVNINLIKKMEQRHMAELEAIKREMEKRDKAHKEEMKRLEQHMNKCLSAQETRIDNAVKCVTDIKEWFKKEIKEIKVTQHHEASTAAKMPQQKQADQGKKTKPSPEPAEQASSTESTDKATHYTTTRTSDTAIKFSAIPVLNFSSKKPFDFTLGDNPLIKEAAASTNNT